MFSFKAFKVKKTKCALEIADLFFILKEEEEERRKKKRKKKKEEKEEKEAFSNKK